MSVEIKGADALAARLDAMQARLDNMQAVTAPIATEVQALIAESLAGHRSPSGTPWAPKVDGSPFDTAELAAATIVVPEPRGFRIAVRTQYAAFWHWGTRRQKARPFVPLERAPDGVRWMRGGPAETLLRSMLQRIAKHVLGG